jgi:hypothetical protein
LQRWRKTEKGMHAMRSRLMAYSRGLHSSRDLRRRFGAVESLDELAAIRAWHENALHDEQARDNAIEVPPHLAHL